MFRRRRGDSDFKAEIDSHIELETDRLIEEGWSPADARAAARRAFGNVTLHQEKFYESSRWMPLDGTLRSLRQAVRQLRKSPAATLAVVLSMALGIGVNTAIFSLADQVLLQLLPVDRPEELVLVWWDGDFPGDGRGWHGVLPHLFFRDLRKENDVFEDVFARCPRSVSLSIDGQARPVVAEVVSGSYFSTLGIRPERGRLIDESDDLQRNGHPVVVISFDYWQNVLGADPGVIGRRVLVNSFPMTVIGVVESGFRGLDAAQVPAIWVPVMMKEPVTQSGGLDDRRIRWLDVFARLKPGVTPEQASIALQGWFEAYKQADMEREGWRPLSEEQMARYRSAKLAVSPASQGRSSVLEAMQKPTLVLLAAAGLILILACLNVANLSMARALSRRGVTCLKSALGASRSRVVAEAIIEALVPTAAGAMLGMLLAPGLISLLLSFVPREDGASLGLTDSLDFRVLFFCLSLTLLAALFSGILPALYSSSVPPASVLRKQSGALAGGLRLRRALVIGQCGLTLILLIGAGLFSQTLGALRARGPGYSTSRLMMFRLDPAKAGYDRTASKELFREALEEIRALPGVSQAGLVRWEMLRGGGWNNPVTVQASQRFVTENLAMNAVSPGFFATLGLPTLIGRDFLETDSVQSGWGLRAAVINDEFRRRYFPDSNPIGARVGIGAEPDTETPITIVGVVPTFQDFRLRQKDPEIFFPLWERTVESGTFYVRYRSDPESVLSPIRGIINGKDKNLSLLSVRTLDDQMDRMLAQERLLATLAGAFGGVATALSLVGLFGVLSFSAERRTREIGIRYALGAPRSVAVRLVVREAAALATAGLVLALPVAWLLGRYVESHLFGVRPMDPLTVLLACAVLALVCLVASALTARRIGAVDPLTALRSE